VHACQTQFVFGETCIERVDTMAPEQTEFEGCKEHKKAQKKAWRAVNADKIKAQKKEWNAANPDKRNFS